MFKTFQLVKFSDKKLIELNLKNGFHIKYKKHYIGAIYPEDGVNWITVIYVKNKESDEEFLQVQSETTYISELEAKKDVQKLCENISKTLLVCGIVIEGNFS